MIRLYTGDGLPPPDNEAALRIGGLWAAYGAPCSFVNIWKTDQGSCLSLLDGAAVLDLRAQEDKEDMFYFLSMQSAVQSVRTDKGTAQELAAFPAFSKHARLSTGQVMRLTKPLPLTENAETVSPRDIYPLLSLCFADAMPPFESWYVDVSHRMRHGVCHIAAVVRDGSAVSSAMTVAEYGGAALFGAVATHPLHRGKGYATACLAKLAAVLPDTHIVLSPKTWYAAQLYTHLGFVPWSEWGTVYRE